MVEKRTIHVLLMNDYFPQLCELTLPTIERWAQKIRGRVNYITKRRWPDWPLLIEKAQVWYDGQDSDWNILLDADILVHPDAPDVLGHFVPRDYVAAKDAYHADTQLKHDIYFERDGRNIGLSSCALIASNWCHDLWRPLPEDMSVDEACANILDNRKCVDEYCFSRNMARYGLKLTAPFDPKMHYDYFYHLGTFGQDPDRMLRLAQDWYRQNWK